ncbi:ABC transporter ATP-binding protein [Candidatus Clostridium radicumherbarum]|uniref:ABC transporter ATP-binding protein n=1 Tax=Candidatus Clostridium radicumherbarum TaxID=3381662 RepID=A0ABW8TQF2_9CLOT
MEILRTYKLTKTYGKGETEVEALKEAEISINRGEFVAVVGPSGSGKSTLLHLIAGLMQPTRGSVLIEGKNIYNLSENELSIFRRRNIGFIFQFFNLLPMLSLEENVILPALLDNKKVDMEYLDELLKVLGLSERRRHLPGALSGGQQQRAAIARALFTKPSIVFADEPTGNLDSKSSKEVLELLTMSIKKYNQTLVLITHDMNVAKHADRIIKIEDGVVSENLKIIES